MGEGGSSKGSFKGSFRGPLRVSSWDLGLGFRVQGLAFGMFRRERGGGVVDGSELKGLRGSALTGVKG